MKASKQGSKCVMMTRDIPSVNIGDDDAKNTRPWHQDKKSSTIA